MGNCMDGLIWIIVCIDKVSGWIDLESEELMHVDTGQPIVVVRKGTSDDDELA